MVECYVTMSEAALSVTLADDIDIHIEAGCYAIAVIGYRHGGHGCHTLLRDTASHYRHYADVDTIITYATAVTTLIGKRRRCYSIQLPYQIWSPCLH